MTEEWVEANERPSSTMFLCPYCKGSVYFNHGSSRKAKANGIVKRCFYRFCPWCGEEVKPFREKMNGGGVIPGQMTIDEIV